jgi:hypothetical protein
MSPPGRSWTVPSPGARPPSAPTPRKARGRPPAQEDGGGLRPGLQQTARQAYLSIIDEAEKTSLRQPPPRIGRRRVSDLGQKSIEHLTGVELACSDREDELRRGRSRPWRDNR